MLELRSERTMHKSGMPNLHHPMCIHTLLALIAFHPLHFPRLDHLCHTEGTQTPLQSSLDRHQQWPSTKDQSSSESKSAKSPANYKGSSNPKWMRQQPEPKHLLLAALFLRVDHKPPTNTFQIPAKNHAGTERDSLTLRQACSLEKPGSAMCVQNLDDSRGLAIRITYHISLRSSSLWEPRHPLLKVVRPQAIIVFLCNPVHTQCKSFCFMVQGRILSTRIPSIKSGWKKGG